MKSKITTVLFRPLWFVALIFFLTQLKATAQTIVFADEISSDEHTDDKSNALGDLSNKAEIGASSGLILGAGAYSGHLELRFTGGVPANTTTYIKIDADDNLFPALLGGSLGDLLSGILGVVLIGNQEFTVQALNGSTTLVRGNSERNNDFASDRLRIVVNANNEYFIAVTPDKAYDRVRITNRLGSLLGFFNTKHLGVYGAYYVNAPNECGTPTFTSYNGTGINLDALNIGGVGVSNPHHVLDNDPNSFSKLSMGVLSVAGSIQQKVYFEGASHATDNFNLRLKVDPSLLTLGVANNIRITAHNGATLVRDVSLSSLLNLDLLTLLQGNAVATIPFSPGSPITSITVRYSALLNVNLTQSLDLYSIIRTPALPVIDLASQNKVVCIGDTASLIATANPGSLEIRWYDDLDGGTLLEAVASGSPYITPNILSDQTFYVATAKPGCAEESARVPVKVTAVQTPTAADINVTGNETESCNLGVTVLLPSSSIPGNFEWYSDNNKTIKINNGDIIDGATHNIDAHGVMTISGLDNSIHSVYYYYASMVFDSGCGNAAGDLKEVVVQVSPNSLNPSITLDNNITDDDIINAGEAAGMIDITGTVSGDAVSGDTVRLIINDVVYSGIVVADLSFSIPVNGSDLVNDLDRTIDAFVETITATCRGAGNDTEGYSVDVMAPTTPTVNAQTTNDTTPVITGTADSVDDLIVEVNGVVYTEGDGNLVDNGDNTWSLTIPDVNALPEGIYDVVVTATDGAGNQAQDVTIDELEIDDSIDVPTVNAQDTDNPTPVITGTANSTDYLTVEVDGVIYSEGDGNLVDNGDNTWTLTIPEGNALESGIYDVVATVTDAAGNTSTDATNNELVINIPIDVPTVNAQGTNDNTPTITGTANSSNALTVEVNGVVYTEGDGHLVDNGDNTWTLTIPDANALPDGIYDVVVTATDSAGNQAQDVTVDELEIDTTVVTPTVDAQDTNDNTPTITGTADSADDLTVEVNGVVYTEGDGHLVDNGDNTWTLTIPEENALDSGIYDVVATVTDSAGNTMSDATTDELEIIAPVSDLTITKVVDRPNPMVGENVIFTIVVTNNGATNFANIVVGEQLRSGFTYVNSTVSNGQYDPIAGIWNITDLVANGTATLTLEAKVGPIGDLTNTATIESSSPPDIDPDNNTVEVTVELNCLTVFNEFSPNNDGANDFFRIECIEKYPSSTLHVYNRYGSLVYKAKGYKNDWNGYSNVGGVINKGEQLPEGNYYYLLTIDELGKDKTGWIYLGR